MAEVRRLRMFAGPNGSGKSSLYTKLTQEDHFRPTVFINADEIQQKLSHRETLQFPLRDGKRFQKLLSESPFLPDLLKPEDLVSLAGDPETGLVLKEKHECSPYLAAAVADAIRMTLLAEGTSFAFETVMSHDSKLDLLKQIRF